jgi:hypothetical protein
MMSSEVIKLAFMLTPRNGRIRIGPLLAAFAIILAANGAIRVWRAFEQAETRRDYNLLLEKAQFIAYRVSSQEETLSGIERELEAKRLLIEKLDVEIRETSGRVRLEALARRESVAKLYNSQAGDYRGTYRKYEGEVANLRDLYESLNRLADELDLPFLEIPIDAREKTP